jgi:hypothetical protein
MLRFLYIGSCILFRFLLLRIMSWLFLICTMSGRFRTQLLGFFKDFLKFTGPPWSRPLVLIMSVIVDFIFMLTIFKFIQWMGAGIFYEEIIKFYGMIDKLLLIDWFDTYILIHIITKHLIL